MNYRRIYRWAAFVRDLLSIFLAGWVLIGAYSREAVGLLAAVILSSVLIEFVATYLYERSVRRAREAAISE